MFVWGDPMPDAMNLMKLILRVLMKLAYTLLIAPWVLCSLIGAGFRRVDSAVRVAHALPYVTATHIACPRGHRSSLRGIFECRGCGSLFAGWVFQACPVCRSSCGHTTCEHCGLSIRNPLI